MQPPETRRPTPLGGGSRASATDRLGGAISGEDRGIIPGKQALIFTPRPRGAAVMDKLAKVCGLFSSAHEGERASAAAAEGYQRVCALLLLLRMQRRLERHVHDFETFAGADIDRVADDIAGLRYLARAFAGRAPQ